MLSRIISKIEAFASVSSKVLPSGICIKPHLFSPVLQDLHCIPAFPFDFGLVNFAEIVDHVQSGSLTSCIMIASNKRASILLSSDTCKMASLI